MKQLQEQKEAELRQKYSKFVDEEQAHVFNPTTISIPNSVNPVDRCLIESKLKNVLYKEMKAVQQATIYRDKCTELKQKCRHLQRKKQCAFSGGIGFLRAKVELLRYLGNLYANRPSDSIYNLFLL